MQSDVSFPLHKQCKSVKYGIYLGELISDRMSATVGKNFIKAVGLPKCQLQSTATSNGRQIKTNDLPPMCYTRPEITSAY